MQQKLILLYFTEEHWLGARDSVSVWVGFVSHGQYSVLSRLQSVVTLLAFYQYRY